MPKMNQKQMMKQVQAMQEQFLALQEQAAQTESSASAGGGMVKVSVSGSMRLTSIKIDPEALDPEDVEMLEDMILAAVNDALSSAEEQANKQMSALTSSLNIPGLF